MEWLTLKQLSERTGLSEEEITKQFDRAPEIKMAKYDKHYDQVAVPSAGGSVPVGKGGDITSPCEALGNPGRFKRGVDPAATERSPKDARDKQLGENGMAGN